LTEELKVQTIIGFPEVFDSWWLERQQIYKWEFSITENQAITNIT